MNFHILLLAPSKHYSFKVTNGGISCRDGTTEEDFKHSTPRYMNSGGSYSWASSDLVYTQSSSTYLYPLLKSCGLKLFVLMFSGISGLEILFGALLKSNEHSILFWMTVIWNLKYLGFCFVLCLWERWSTLNREHYRTIL